MTNNFGLGSRSMDKAGSFALRKAATSGLLSYSSEATLGHRWSRFITFLRKNIRDVRKLEGITFDTVIEYGKELALMVSEDDMSASTAQNYVSAVNSVMDISTKGKWKSVSPTIDCGIPKRSFIRTDVPVSLDRSHFDSGLEYIRTELGDRAGSILELAREFGLRTKEASLFDPRTSLNDVERTRCITIRHGTKGGKTRTLEISTEMQIDIIKRAAIIQGRDRSLITAHLNWREWRDGELRNIREAIQEKLGAKGLHDLRAAYACERYNALTGFPSPLLGGPKPDKQTDRNARLQIAKELGHGRPEISSAYLGGLK